MPFFIYSLDTNAEKNEEKIYKLMLGVNSIGREIDNSIILTDQSISRHHAEIEVENRKVTLRDLNSANGTFIYAIQIKKHILQENDEIRFGNVLFRFTSNFKSIPEKLRSSIAKESTEEKLQGSIIKKYGVGHKAFISSDQWPIENKSRSLIFLQKEDPHQRTIDKLKVLLDISKQICSPEEPDKLLEKVLDLLWTVMNVDRAAILMVDEESDQLKEKVIKVKPEMKEDQKFYSTQITNLVRDTGEAILIANPIQDERFNESQTVLSLSIKASMCVPLQPKDQVIGVLYVDSSSVTATYSEEDLEFLTALANQVAVAIHMASEFSKREKKLQEEVIELKIQIDQQKKEEEVDEIISSDVFHRIKERVNRLRRKR